MKNGLDPQYADPIHVEDEKLNDNSQSGPPYQFIYLSPYSGTARQFGPGGYYRFDKNKKNSALLKIELPEELQNRLITDRGEFVRSPFVIPPEYIQVVK